MTDTEKQEKKERWNSEAHGLALLEADPTLAQAELDRRHQNRERKARGERKIPAYDQSLVNVTNFDLKRFADA